MAREFRPNRKAFYVSFAVTFVALGGVWFMSQTSTLLKATYAPKWETHGKYYLDKGCADCHEPFKAVSDDSCFTCHADYRSGFPINDEVIYEAGWAGDAETVAQKQRGTARVKHAHLLYHDIPDVRAMTCASCHPEHIPPPPPDGWDFVHRHGAMLPETVDVNNCIQCHSAVQAPPIEAHNEYLAGGGRDCSVCHRSNVAWKVEVAFKPAGEVPNRQFTPPAAQDDTPVPMKSLREGQF